MDAASPAGSPAAPAPPTAPPTRAEGFAANLARSVSGALGGWLVTGVIAVGAVKAVDAIDAALNPEAEQARRAKEQVELVLRFLPLLDDKAGLATRSAALATLDFLRQQRGLDPSLTSGITAAIGAKTSDADPRLAAQASVALEAGQRALLRQAQLAPELAAALGEASGAAPAAVAPPLATAAPTQISAELQSATRAVDAYVAQARPRVYIQVPRDDTSAGGLLAQATQAMRAIDWLVPPPEPVDPARMPRRTQVRYFNQGDLPRAQACVQALAQAGITATAVRVPLAAPEGQLELWLVPTAGG